MFSVETGAAAGNANNVSAGAGDDYVFGGDGPDVLAGEAGADVMFGDHGHVLLTWDPQAQGTVQRASHIVPAETGHVSLISNSLPEAIQPADQASSEHEKATGTDKVNAGTGNNIVFGGYAADTIITEDGADVVFGDFGVLERATLANGKWETVTTESLDADYGGSDIIAVSGGADLVFAGLGNDTVTAGAGDDVVFGDHGSATLKRNDKTRVYKSTFTSQDGGTDNIAAHGGDDLVFGGADDDTIDAANGDDVVFGDHGQATYTGLVSVFESTSPEEGGADIIVARGGNDLVFAGLGKDTVTAGAGDDVVFGDHGSATLKRKDKTRAYKSTFTSQDGGADEIATHSGDDLVFGGADDDTINVANGDNVVFGDHGQATYTGLVSVFESTSPEEGGADIIVSRGGNDLVFGGGDNDVISTHSGDDVVFGDHGHVTRDPQAKTTLLTSTATEMGGNDTISVSDGNDLVFGGAEGDKIEAAAGDDVVFGDHGSVSLVDTVFAYVSTSPEVGGADTVVGGEGDDIVFGGMDADTILGNDGSDVVFGDHGNVTRVTRSRLTLLESVYVEHGGDDTIHTHDAKDFVFGGFGNDTVSTSTGDDVVFGDHGRISLTPALSTYESTSAEQSEHGGADTIDTGAGNDYVFAGQDDDTIATHEGDDTVFGDFGYISAPYKGYPLRKVSTWPQFGGSDTVHSGAGEDLVFGGAEGDTLLTGGDDDVAFGDHGEWVYMPGDVSVLSIFTEPQHNGGNDIITLASGDDLAFGGQGADNITGNSGNDWLFGDQGHVAQRRLQVAESIDVSSGGDDHITGDEGQDYIFGGAGNDYVHGGSDEDFIFGDNGHIQQEAKSSKGTRLFTATATGSVYGGDDVLLGGSGDDVVLGQQGADRIEGGDGLDMLFGDHAEAELERARHQVMWAQTTAPVSGLGGGDTIFGGNGEDYVFGGTGSDTLHGGNGSDVILGDHALFNASFRVAHQYRSIYTQEGDAGGNDTIHGDAGDDFILGQQGDDTIYGGSGEDDIIGGHDVLDGVDGSDTIDGGADADVVLGDNGLIDRRLHLPTAEVVPPPATPSPAERPSFCDEYSVLFPQEGGVEHPARKTGKDKGKDDDNDNDRHGWNGPTYGPNENLCWVTHCVGNSVRINWRRFATERRYDFVSLYTINAKGQQDLVWQRSGWDVPEDETYSQDVLVRFSSDGYTEDLGFALDYECAAPTPVPQTPAPAPLGAMYHPGPPYANSRMWLRYPGAPRFSDVVRFVQRFDDVDGIAGNDTILGSSGDDVLHGQRGDDTIDGGAGDDEVHGEQGSDVLRGGEGADIVLGDMGHVVRAFTADGSPRVNVQTGAWHRDIVLEEQAHLAPLWVETWQNAHFEEEDAAALLRADLLLSMGGYMRDGETKKTMPQRTRNVWRTVLTGLRLLNSGNDELHGDGGDDILIGQRGDDSIDGGAGNDFVYGDTVSSKYHYDSCLPLVTTVVRVLRRERHEGSSGKVDLPFFGHVVHVPMWVAPEQASRAAAMRPVDDAAVSIVLPRDLLYMLDAVAAADFTLTDTDDVMRPFVATTPDMARHPHAVYGNDRLEGGEGNDVVVGDAAFHHALVNLEVPALETLREQTAARWGEIQFRLARLSVDASTFEADRGVSDLPLQVASGNDRISGGSGNDTLVGDRLEAFTDVVYHQHFTYTHLKQVVKDLMLVYFDYEVLAVDLAHALFEAHHSIVRTLLTNPGTPKLAPEVKLFVSNDNIDGGDGEDVAVGDTLLLVTKGLFLNHTHSGNYFTRIELDKAHNPYKYLLVQLQKAQRDHIRYDFHPSDAISGGNLRRRWEWNTMPYTRWGCDTVRGGSGDDSLLGDYALSVVATFEGDPFHPSSPYGLRSIDTALHEHLQYVQGLLGRRLTAPSLKWHAQTLQDTSFDPDLKPLSMYHDKGRGPRGHDEPASGSQSDHLYGEGGSDMLSGSNGVSVTPMWRLTNTVLVSRHIKVPVGFYSALDPEKWARLREYEKRDRSVDEDELVGGYHSGERDVLLVEDLKHDRVSDKQRWVDSVYYRPSYAYIADILRDSLAGAMHGTCLNVLALDGVIPDKSIHKALPLPVHGWHGIFGIVWTEDGLREPKYFLDHRHHTHHTSHDQDAKDKSGDKWSDDDTDDGKASGDGGCGKMKHDWSQFLKCMQKRLG